jgi:predicted metalloprotease
LLFGLFRSKKGIAVLVVLIGVMWLFGINPLSFITGGGAPSAGISNNNTSQQSASTSDTLYQMVSVVLADTEEVWNDVFMDQLGRDYPEPRLTIFTEAVESGCGYASAQVGPFYCPLDKQIYIDLGFYSELHTQFQAPGDFAMAYVVAHEVGHHVQNVLGTLDEVQRLKSTLSQEEANALQVKVELQADYYAGLWAHFASNYDTLLEEGDLEEALRAAAAIGDDMIQKRTRGYVVPESFTHGTSEQRQRWLLKGYRSGKIKDGDTFTAQNL